MALEWGALMGCWTLLTEVLLHTPVVIELNNL